MLVSLNFYALIPLLTLLQGLIFATLLILRGAREERYSDYLLAFSLFLLAINGIPWMLGWMEIDILWEKFTYLPWDGFWLAIPPLVYLFLKSLTNDQWRFSFRRDAWHFWAYVLYFIEHLIVGTINFTDKTTAQWWGTLPIIHYLAPALNWGIEIYYFILSYRLYQQYHKWTFNEFSDPERVSFKWFRNYLIVKFIVTLIAMTNSVYVHLSPENGEKFYALMWGGYLMDTVLMYYLSISGYMQARVRAVRFNKKDREIPIETSENQAYTEGVVSELKKEDIKIKNTIPDEELSVWKNKLLSLFEKEQPYLNPELTLSDLAEKLKTNTSILSQVINTGFNKNFNDFVNEYRVEDFKKKIQAPDFQHLTLLAIAFDCGFNSKTTFNRAVKKATNQMPSDFIVK